MSTEERWARVVLAAQDPQSVADRDTVLRDAMEIGLGLEPGILACSVSELSGAGHRTSVWSSGLALDLDVAQYAADAGPCLAAARSGTVELVAGGPAQARYPSFAAAARRHGVRSSLSVPLAGSPRPAALNLYAAAVTTFDGASSRAGAGLLARCLGPVLAGEALEEELPTEMVDAALARRAGILRAQDTLSAQHQIGRQEALSMLIRRSQEENRSIHEVAEDVRGGAGTEAAS